MCEQVDMDKPSINDLMKVAGISKSYACEILGSKSKPPKAPSRSLAVFLFRELGWRHESIADLPEEQMAMVETLDPYTRKAA